MAENKPAFIEGLALKSIALWSLEETKEALRLWDTVLDLAEPERFCRIILDLGEPVRLLLGEYIRIKKKNEPHEQYARFLWNALVAPDRILDDELKKHPDLVEPLSDRELEILSLAAGGLQNQEIAQKLNLTLSTIKWHLYNVYGKLNARSRTEAVLRARELELMQ